jgi:hypothetical protein
MELIATIRKIAELTDLLRENDKNVSDSAIKFGTLIKLQEDRKYKLDELKARMLGGHDNLWEEWMNKLHEFARAARDMIKLQNLRDELEQQTKLKEEELKNLQMHLSLELMSQEQDVAQKYGLL